MKRIAILGSTGSIGINSLEVIKRNPELFYPAYLTTFSNANLLIEQVRTFHPKGVVVLDKYAASTVKENINADTEVLVGEEGLLEIASRDDVDIVISALVGFAGLKPTIRAIECGKNIALANKETLVVAGEFIMPLLKKHHVNLLPIDSEHSAILQCLVGENVDEVEKIILTASGGPFRSMTKNEIRNATVQDALNHPNWKMGNKITIDSATLMNKGLEVIEAHWLFGLPPDRISVLIHPQSIIHSMVQFVDGSIKAQLGVPDMKIPIQYALTYPSHIPATFSRVDFTQIQSLTFEQPDVEVFECLSLAYQALKESGTMPAALNASNEVAVQSFLQEQISFGDIPHIIASTLHHHRNSSLLNLESITEADHTAREYALHYISKKSKQVFIPAEVES